MTDSQTFFVKLRAEVTGPHTRDEIAHMVREGTLSPVHRVSLDQERWQPLHEIENWRDLWIGSGSTTYPHTESTAEPPPLPLRVQEQSPGNGDRNEPIDVEFDIDLL